MSRRTIFACLAIVLIVFSTTTCAGAEEATDASGQWRYVVEDGGATITGYVEEPIGDLVIPGELDGHAVTAIGDRAFAECMDVTGVTIPESVTGIDVEAFYLCVSLTDVIIPDGVTSIGVWAFKECYSLESVTIGSSVTSIGGCAFFGCEALTDIAIPDSVTSIGSLAFAHCYSLTSVIIPDNVTDIGESAFIDCEELTLTVQGGSYAEQYAKDNDIPYALALAEAAETTDAQLIRQIDEYFTLSREELIGKLGPGYADVPAGPEGACDGYYYEELGMAFAFYPDSDTLECIDCYPDFKIHGVGTGSLFSEILEALGDTEIVETWLELPIYTAYMVRYRFGNADYSFIAFEKDAPVDILWIAQTSNPDDGVFSFIDGNTFCFSSGAGGWSTELTLSKDGSFAGLFHDSDMGDTGEGYPGGTVYECAFSGTFTLTAQIDPYTYELRLTVLDMEGEMDAESIVDGIKFITTDAYGLSGGDVFMLYRPGRETADLPEAFLEWIRMPNAWAEVPATLPFWGLFNVKEDMGFFSYEER